MKDISSIAKAMVQKEKCREENITMVSRNNFKFLYVIGKGGFGRVWKVQFKKTNEIFALKEMSKLKIIDKKSEKSINSERLFLSKLHNPFIINMHYAFQDTDNLYLVMDMLSGGDLRYHISKYVSFSEEQTRFFISNVLLSLKYIHSNNVIHRDIKPENLVLDARGYVRVTDFGIAKTDEGDNSSETSGTPGYMAPEVIRGKNHGKGVDFFALGVIGYEFMLGRRPYNGKDRKQIKEQMINKAAVINKENIVKGWSVESADFINKLLQRKPEKRLGYNKGADELMNHPWLKYYPWSQLTSKSLPPPFVPDNSDNFDRYYCEFEDRVSAETRLRYEEIMNGETIMCAFEGFWFNKEEKVRDSNDNEDKDGNKDNNIDKDKKKDNKNEDNDKKKKDKLEKNKSKDDLLDDDNYSFNDDSKDNEIKESTNEGKDIKNDNYSKKENNKGKNKNIDDNDSFKLPKDDSLEDILKDDSLSIYGKHNKNKIIDDVTLDKSFDVNLANISESKLLPDDFENNKLDENQIDNKGNNIQNNKDNKNENKINNFLSDKENIINNNTNKDENIKKNMTPYTHRNNSNIKKLANYEGNKANQSQKIIMNKNADNELANLIKNMNNTNSPLFPRKLCDINSVEDPIKKKIDSKRDKHLSHSISTRQIYPNTNINNLSNIHLLEKYINSKQPLNNNASNNNKSKKDLFKSLAKFNNIRQPSGFPLFKKNDKNIIKKPNNIQKKGIKHGQKCNININNFYTNNIFLQVCKDYIPIQNQKISKGKNNIINNNRKNSNNKNENKSNNIINNNFNNNKNNINNINKIHKISKINNKIYNPKPLRSSSVNQKRATNKYNGDSAEKNCEKKGLFKTNIDFMKKRNGSVGNIKKSPGSAVKKVI